MFGFGNLGSVWKRFLKMPAPAGRVIALAIFVYGCVVEDSFNPSPHTTSGFRFLQPQRFNYLRHQRDIDCLHGQGANERVNICRKCIAPLLPVLSVLPGRLGRGNIGLGAIPKRHRLGLLDKACLALFAAVINWVNAFGTQSPRFGGEFSRAL